MSDSDHHEYDCNGGGGEDLHLCATCIYYIINLNIVHPTPPVEEQPRKVGGPIEFQDGLRGGV